MYMDLVSLSRLAYKVKVSNVKHLSIILTMADSLLILYNSLSKLA